MSVYVKNLSNPIFHPPFFSKLPLPFSFNPVEIVRNSTRFFVTLFGHFFLFGKFFYQPKKHFLCLLVNIGKVAVQLSTCQQIYIQNLMILL